MIEILSEYGLTRFRGEARALGNLNQFPFRSRIFLETFERVIYVYLYNIYISEVQDSDMVLMYVSIILHNLHEIDAVSGGKTNSNRSHNVLLNVRSSIVNENPKPYSRMYI